MSRAVVLLSGGVDSSTTLAIAKAEGYEVHALTFDYAQRHRIELIAASQVARALGVKQHLVITFDLGAIGGSALTADIAVPKGRMEEQKRGSAEASEHGRVDERTSGSPEAGKTPATEVIPVTYVPARNTIFLSFGLAWAEVLEAPHLFIGANAVDYSGYPDCRPEYLQAFEAMANLATRASVEGTMRFSVHAPLLSLTKSEILAKGAERGLDYGLTWSCYDPQPVSPEEQKPGGTEETRSSASGLPHVRAYKPCGACDSCRYRRKGFQEAGIQDPLVSLYASGN